jgi:hypothetical protein
MNDKYYYKKIFQEKQRKNILLDVRIIDNYKYKDKDKEYIIVLKNM